MVSIHDPIHGAIELSETELGLVGHALMQRLRHIRQLGFSELAFPGATHSRFAHSVGAMYVAGEIFDAVATALPPMPTPMRARLRQQVRLAALLHDVGHPPLSHVSEQVMPKRAMLQLPAWYASSGDTAVQATHEDMAAALLLVSPVAQEIAAILQTASTTAEEIVGILAARHPKGFEGAWMHEGCDLLPLLAQIVSGEMDADRIDYLRRDAYCCGVPYGHVDQSWLTQNLSAAVVDDAWVMAVQHRGVWAFENFLLARYHMFLAVYHHHTPVCFDHLLGRFFAGGGYALPSDLQDYLQCDDVHLWHSLRHAEDPWAQAVTTRRPYALLLETHGYGDGEHAPGRDPIDAQILACLKGAGIDHFHTDSQGVLSKYFPSKSATPLMVLEPERGRLRRIDVYTPLYRRFEEAARVARVYCKPEDLTRARKVALR